MPSLCAGVTSLVLATAGAIAVLLLAIACATKPTSSILTDERIRDAVTRAVPLMQDSTDIWFEKRSCSTFHHQGLGTVAMSVIRERGFAVDTGRLSAESVRTMQPAANWQERFVIGDASINQSIRQTYRAIGAAAAGYPNNDKM